jgi:hypothetical protein
LGDTVRVLPAHEARESGFYWVMSGREWTIAEWDSSLGNWSSVLGYGDTADNVNDNFFDEIDERKIVREGS